MEAFLIVLVVFIFLAIVFLVLAFRFPDDLATLLGRMSSVEVTTEGLKIALVAEAVVQKEHRKPKAAEIRPLVTQIPDGRLLLWVDDSPANNRAEIQALRALGLTVDVATTNKEAQSYVSRASYDLVLSDIGRGKPEAATAGLELPGVLREAHVDAPLAFYVGEATEHTTPTGEAVFDTPTALLGWVRDQLKGVTR